MKKFVLPALFAAAACTLLVACGPNSGGLPSGDTDPEELAGQQVNEAQWSTAFAEEKNYTLKSVVTASSEDDGTMSQTATYCYRVDGDKVCLEISVVENGKTVMQGEAYLECGEQTVMWERSKEGDGEWSDWDVEDYDAESIGFVRRLVGDLSFLKEDYANFSYSKDEKGYIATEEGLGSMRSGISAFSQGVLSQIPDAAADYSAEKFVVKISGGKLGACILDLKASSVNDTTYRFTHPRRTTRLHIPLPEIPLYRFGIRRPVRPRITLDIPLPLDEAPTGTKSLVNVTQLYFDYGTTQVKLPENLPSPDPETTENE